MSRRQFIFNLLPGTASQADNFADRYREGRCPISPVIPAKEDGLIACNRAKAADEKVRPFAPASYGYVLNPVGVFPCK